MGDFGLGAAGEAIDARFAAIAQVQREIRAEQGSAAAERNALRGRVGVLEGLHASDEPAPEPEYGHRQGPREVDGVPFYPDALWDGVGDPIDKNGNGHTVLRSALPYWWTQSEWNGRGLYNLTVDNDTQRQVAVYAHALARGMDLIDVTFTGFAGVDHEDRGHVGVVDLDRTRRMRAINVRIDDAGEHGLEARGEVRGGHVKARQVAYAGNPSEGDVVEDMILEWLDTPTDRPNEWHWGAMKSGGDVIGAAYRRVVFKRGCAWTDSGAVHSYEDCQFLDSPGWGEHHEVDKWHRAAVPPLTISYSTFGRNTGDTAFANRLWHAARRRGEDGNGAHVQHGHITPHMGTVVADHCLIDLDVTVEVGWCEWSDNGRRNGQEPPSGVRQTSVGSGLTDSLIVVTHEVGQRVDGLIAKFQHPEWNTWERVVLRMPIDLRDARLFLIGVNGGASWRRLTAAEFIEQHAPTCSVELV